MVQYQNGIQKLEFRDNEVSFLHMVLFFAILMKPTPQAAERWFNRNQGRSTIVDGYSYQGSMKLRHAC